MEIPPLDLMPMMFRECSAAAVYVQEKLSDELPVSQFTAESIGEQAVFFSHAAEQAEDLVARFLADEQALREEIEAATINLEEAEQRLADAHAMETRWPCTGCHLLKAAAVLYAEERLIAARHRLKVAEEALETMERVLAVLPSTEWVSPCEEVMAGLDRFDPHSANDIRQFFVSHRELLEELAGCTGGIAGVVDELPRKFFADIRDRVDEIASLIMRAAGHADDTETEFGILHEVEIMRLDDPRPGEVAWDIGQNGVTGTEVGMSGPRGGGSTPAPDTEPRPEETDDDNAG